MSPVLETERLLLRPWRVEEAPIQRELWTERDPRVPAHRRIDADGRPSIGDLEQWIRRDDPAVGIGLLALERRLDGEVIGYCGLVGDAPEIAFELLRRWQGQGYATEAAEAVVAAARAAGIRRLTATVWAWNRPSRRVLEKLGFRGAERGSQLVLTKDL
jgi:[ribosomal protein S5]-alanine N-acetyltransferase